VKGPTFDIDGLRRCKNGRTEHHTCRRWAGESAEGLWSLREPYYFKLPICGENVLGYAGPEDQAQESGITVEEQAQTLHGACTLPSQGYYSRRRPDPTVPA